MSSKKSKPYTVDGKQYVFGFDSDNKINSIFNVSGRSGKVNPLPVDPNSSRFSDLANSESGTRAYNVNRFKGIKESYLSHANGDRAVQATSSELNSEYTKNTKSRDNESFIETDNSTALAFSEPKDNSTKSKDTKIMQYPEDIDKNQDHLKISRYNYVRPNLNMSKSAGRTNVGEGFFSGTTGRTKNVTNSGQPIEGTVAGDSVVGSDLKSIILLPMPKVTDVNGVEWGKSELNSSGLTALNITNELTGRGRLSGKNEQDRLNDVEIREAIASRREANSVREGAAALYTGTIAKLAGTLTGSDLDADTFLARQGGKVLNPNAEMLFQGPVIRDFGFSFVMIARSEEEGREIRSIIRFLKLGLAPKFRSTTFLKAPDIFTLHYKNGQGENDTLKTVNLFNPGGLALTTMNVDYAPFGYWSAYRDSQPVAVKMDLNFTELRPLYQSDQLETPENSVGY